MRDDEWKNVLYCVLMELLLFLDSWLFLCFNVSLERDVGGCSSVGRVQASQAWGREFKPRRPLQCQ